MGPPIPSPATGEVSIDSASVLARQTREARMNRPELEQRLAELAAEIEQAQSRVWLCEHEREQLRHSLRKLINDESKAAMP
jgi:predicted secreted protein